MSLLLTSYALSAYSLVWTGVSPARLHPIPTHPVCQSHSYSHSPPSVLSRPCLVFRCRLHRRCGFWWYCSPSVPMLALGHLSSPVPPCTRKRFPGSHAGTKRSRDDFFEPACPSVYATRWIRQAHAMARMGVRVSPDAYC